MEPATKPTSKVRIVLTWVMMVVLILAITLFCFWRSYSAASGSAPTETSETPAGVIVHSIFFLIAGGFFLVLGVIAYLIVVATGCFTFDYSRPVWPAVKIKQYFANIIVPLGLGLGIGFVASAFLSPVLTGLGLDSGMANMAPLIGAVVGFQLMQLWVLIWAPVEKHIIVKRLATMGITRDHLKDAMLVGISNPASGFAKRVGAIEEDMGAVWVTQQQLMFRCDAEQFDLNRSQVVEIERKADKGSTTMLAGIAHVILHVKLPDGNIRQMRLHMEGLWTMGQKKKAMDTLADAIIRWHGADN